MTVSLSCDHRVIDGAGGANWLGARKDLQRIPLLSCFEKCRLSSSMLPGDSILRWAHIMAFCLLHPVRRRGGREWYCSTCFGCPSVVRYLCPIKVSKNSTSDCTSDRAAFCPSSRVSDLPLSSLSFPMSLISAWLLLFSNFVDIKANYEQGTDYNILSYVSELSPGGSVSRQCRAK